MKKKNIILSIILLFVIILTCVIFFGSVTERTGILTSAFSFILATELVCFLSIILIINNKFNTFVVAGISSTIFLYTLCSLLFNILFVSVFKSVRSILVFNFSLLLIYLIICAIIFLFRKEK